MYDLIKVSDTAYYIESPAKVGLIKVGDDEVILIDSGNDKDAGKKILKIINGQGWHLAAIYNTHSNADHIGGNQYLQQATGCKIYAPGIEADFTNHPILEPSILYGGYPSASLRHKFLLAKESFAQPLDREGLPGGLTAISLPGHFLDMVGYRTQDDVVFLADCLASKETLDKYAITFIYDVKAYIDTLLTVKEMKARLFIPSHAAPTKDIAELAQYNIDKVREIEEKILSICEEPRGFDEILKALFDTYSLMMTSEQHALVGSTVRSYLSYLCDGERLRVSFDGNIMKWEILK